MKISGVQFLDEEVKLVEAILLKLEGGSDFLSKDSDMYREYGSHLITRMCMAKLLRRDDEEVPGETFYFKTSFGTAWLNNGGARLRKYMRIRFGDGSEWDIPTYIIARVYADDHASIEESDDGRPYDEGYQEAFKRILEDERELIRFTREQMDWQGLEYHAVRVDLQETNYGSEYPYVKFTLVMK